MLIRDGFVFDLTCFDLSLNSDPLLLDG